ncbi:MAG: hypothetical protein AAF840_07785 [Bacteroidota bacterium]
MKHLLRVFTVTLLLLSTTQVWAQGQTTKLLSSKMTQRLSITATAATQAESLSSLGDYNLEKLTNVRLGELSVTYRINERFSLGLGSISGLGVCGGYTDAEGNFVSFGYDDDDDDYEDDDDEEDDEEDDYEDDEDECYDDDFEFENLMAILSVRPFNNLPIFAQVAGGYTFGARAPAYSLMVGARQPLISGLALTGGFRFSDVMHRLPAGATDVLPSSGMRLELGLNWSL